MIINQIFTGREECPPPKPRTRPPVPVWDRLSGAETHARAEDTPTGWPNEDDTSRQDYNGRNNAHGRENEASDAVIGADHRQDEKFHRELRDGRLVEDPATTSTQRTTVPVLNLSMKP